MREWIEDTIIAGALVLFLALTSGCTIPIGSSGRGFWDQQVSATAWGITMVTMYGPFTIGYLQWQRNLDENITPAKPMLPRSSIP